MPNTNSSTDMLLEQDLLVFWNHENKAHMLHIQHDEDVRDPRTEMDHFTVMACFHPRHTLGDQDRMGTAGAFWEDLVMKNVPHKEILSAAKSGKLAVPCEPDDEPTDDEEWLEAVSDWILDGDSDGIKAAMELLKGKIACLPLWLYDHSGLTMSCGERAYPYNDRFDSSAVGWIVALKSDVLKELQCGDVDWEEKAEAVMKAEVDTYDRWLRGDVWAACHHESKSAVGSNEPLMCPARHGGGREAMSGAQDWNDGEWTCGFYGDHLSDSGIAESVGCGLPEALASGEYWTGKAKSQQVTVWTYVRDVPDGEE